MAVPKSKKSSSKKLVKLNYIKFKIKNKKWNNFYLVNSRLNKNITNLFF